MKPKAKRVREFLSAVQQMTLLAWQAQKFIFVSLLSLEIVQGFMPLASAWIIKQIFDVLTTNQGDTLAFTQKALPWLAVQGGIAVAVQMITHVNAYFEAELGRQLQLKTQTIIYERVADLSGLAYFENPEFHNTLELASQGIYSGPAQILKTFTYTIRSSITLLSFMGALFFLSPLLAVIIACASLPQLIAQLKIGRQRFSVAYLNSPKARLIGYLGQVLSSFPFAKEMRLFNLKRYFLERFTETTRDVQRTQRAQQLREISWQLGLGVTSSAATSLAFIIVVSQAFSGRITIGDVTLYFSALSSVQGAVSSIIFAFASLNESVLFFARYSALMALPPMLKIADSPRPVPPLQSEIEFRNVSFRYTNQHPWVLRRINLTIPKSQCLALVGVNGVGKTTIVKLLTRLYDPNEGQILWDGIDIREFDPTEYRKAIGAIFQDFMRYDLTVKENIGLGDVDRIDDLNRIQQAAQKAGIHRTVEQLAQGYQTVLSRWLVEDGPGTDLSGGQWQKIAIARLFMRDADLLILDEPTAALDAEAEYEIYSHFAELVSGHTSLLISHRFSTVRIADQIAVLDNGEIVEYGPHEELMTNHQLYARLYSMQAERYMNTASIER